jgi:hypothetical protein
VCSWRRWPPSSRSVEARSFSIEKEGFAVKIRNRWTLPLLAALFAAGCSATGTLPKEVGERAKNLTPPEGKALVYVIRPAGAGMAVSMKVSCDGTYLGTTGGHRFI